MNNNGLHPVLYLIPAPIGDTAHASIKMHFNIINSLSHFFVENERTARRLLRASGYDKSLDMVWLFEVNEHNQQMLTKDCLAPLLNGHSAGVISEAGLPCVADPGYSVVRLAHQHDIQVCPLVGESSLMLALMASGLQGQQFTFHGYLPVKELELKKKVLEIEKQAQKGYTQIFIETPYRNERLLQFLVRFCQSELLLCIASSLLTDEERIATHPIHYWKLHPPVLKNKPAVFLLGT